MSISFNNRVAIVTGAGGGLGRSHALGLAARGVKLVVNDLGQDGKPSESALAVVEEIKNLGGEAFANGANVADWDQVKAMVDETMQRWGHVDILVNNAGILRDKSFVKMSLDDFRLVMDVHVMGTVNCTKAVWDIMREQQYGRIAMTSSSSGLYGNFGQSNYGAAKMAVVGLMNTLHLEGQKYGIHVNTLSPTARTEMTENIIAKEVLELMTVESVSAALLYLVCDEAPSRLILCAGAGGYASTRIYETEGIYLPVDQQTPEHIAEEIDRIVDADNQALFQMGSEQTIKFVNKAAEALGVKI
ncbi:SDR family NAD(P)-dependent oxidoreductase [Emcibacter sp.]|uniref:SDR family NAD(P)-dependent oxidoreductase n=1 Tax=Emcibacter sp. TaxID=1979954 RepID=UPI003A933B0F